MKRFFLFLIIIISFSCTNPEVNFPDEDPKKETKTTKTISYQAPALLVYSKNFDSPIFFHLFALAQSNQAEEKFFLVCPEEEKSIVQSLKKLKQNTGLTPGLVCVDCTPASYWDAIKEQVDKVVWVKGEHLSLIEETKEDLNRFLFLPQTGKKNKEKLEDIENQEKLLQVEEKEHNLEPDLKEKTEAEDNTLKKIEETKELTPDLENLKKELDKQTIKEKEIESSPEKKNNNEEIIKQENTPHTEKKENQAEEEKLTTWDLKKELKNPDTLLKILNHLGGQKYSQTNIIKQDLLTLKGRTEPSSKLSVISFLESGKEKEGFVVLSTKSGEFPALIIDRTQSFEVNFLKESKSRRGIFLGLVSSYPFFNLFFSSTFAEIKSYFTPIPLESIPLPKGLEFSEKQKAENPAIYKVVFDKKEKAQINIVGNKVQVFFTEDFAMDFKWNEKTYPLKLHSTLFLLD